MIHDHTQLDTPNSVGDLSMSDQPNTTLTRDKHPCPQRDSNPQSQQASGHRPMP